MGENGKKKKSWIVAFSPLKVWCIEEGGAFKMSLLIR